MSKNYLIKTGLLPNELNTAEQYETLLNQLGNPYELRKKALTQPLSPFELGRIILHMASRRGFQSSRKTLWGNLVDDPDVLELLQEEQIEEGENTLISDEQAKEEKGMKAEISQLWQAIQDQDAETLGEYLANLPLQERKRGRRTGAKCTVKN